MMKKKKESMFVRNVWIAHFIDNNLLVVFLLSASAVFSRTFVPLFFLVHTKRRHLFGFSFFQQKTKLLFTH